MGEISDGDLKGEAWQGDGSKPANESAAERNARIHREVEAACRADPNCIYDDGTGDDDDAFVFFDNHVEHRHKGKVTRKRALTR